MANKMLQYKVQKVISVTDFVIFCYVNIYQALLNLACIVTNFAELKLLQAFVQLKKITKFLNFVDFVVFI